MTEAEAKKRWCPMVRVHTGMTDFVSAANRNLLERDAHRDRCIGSAWMMWRTQETPMPADAGKSLVRVETIGGYCGLAGKP